MDTYTKGVVRRLVLFLVLYALMATILFVIASLFRISVDYATLAVVLGIFVVALFMGTLVEPVEPDEHAHDDNVYSEDETDLYDIIVNKPAETTDEKPVDAATETTDGTAGTGAEDETDDKA